MESFAPIITAFWQMVATPEPPELGPGPRPGVRPRAELECVLETVLSPGRIKPAAALRLRATALLYHDHHDPAHDIVQDLTDRDAALIHAILHRREPDYWNAKYWFRRVDLHPAHLALARRLEALSPAPADRELVRQLTLPGAFDPFAFVDECEAVERRAEQDSRVLWLRRVQQAEFEEVVTHLLAA